jgi:hypothetical protein
LFDEERIKKKETKNKKKTEKGQMKRGKRKET